MQTVLYIDSRHALLFTQHIHCQCRNNKLKQYYTLVVIVDTVVQSSPHAQAHHMLLLQ